MSDSAQKRSGSAPPTEKTAGAEEPAFVPRRLTPNQLFGAGRGEAVVAEREAANQQIQRTLRIWRKASGDGHPAKTSEEKQDDCVDEISEPEDAAEKEADAVAEEVTSDDETPKVNAKLDGIGRKVFLARDPNEENVRKQIEQEGAALVQQFKQEGVGADAGRSGGHGDPYKRAGAELIRRGNAVPKNDPRREIYKTVGNRLIEKGKSISHPGKR